jgi:hypothetical protein
MMLKRVASKSTALTCSNFINPAYEIEFCVVKAVIIEVLAIVSTEDMRIGGDIFRWTKEYTILGILLAFDIIQGETPNYASS